MLKTGVVTDRRYLKHFAGRSHPERPERVEAMIEMAESLERPDLKFIAPREATDEEIESCHVPEYVATVARTASSVGSRRIVGLIWAGATMVTNAM